MQKFFLNIILVIGAGLFAFGIGCQISYAAIPDPLINGGFEQAGATAPQAYDWQAFGSGYRRLSGQAHGGSWSIRLVNNTVTGQSGAYQRVDLQQTAIKPVFIGGYVKGSNVVGGRGSYLGAGMYAEIHLADGSVAYWNSVGNYGTFPWRWVGFNTGTVSAVNQPIDYIFVVPILAQASGTAYFDDLQVSDFDPSKGAVTLMFDDGEISTLTQAKPLLDSVRFPGTAAIVTSFIGDDGYMNLDNLRTLESSGWEIVSHSVSHDDMTTMSLSRIKTELSQSKQVLRGAGFTINHFAMPFGAYNAQILGEGANYYKSMRAFEQGDNPQGVFPFDVKVRGVLNSTTSGEFQSWLDRAVVEKRWLILTFHTIAETGDDQYHTTPAMFKEMIKRVAASGLPVITYDQGIKAFAVTQ